MMSAGVWREGYPFSVPGRRGRGGGGNEEEGKWKGQGTAGAPSLLPRCNTNSCRQAHYACSARRSLRSNKQSYANTRPVIQRQLFIGASNTGVVLQRLASLPAAVFRDIEVQNKTAKYRGVGSFCLNRVQPQTAACKLTNPRSSHALLRSLTPTQALQAHSAVDPVQPPPAAGKLTNRVKLPARRVAIIVAAFVSLAFVPAAAHAEPCPNEKLREEQPYGQELPDCRAYEMVSPPNTNGQDATSYDAPRQLHAHPKPPRHRTRDRLLRQRVLRKPRRGTPRKPVRLPPHTRRLDHTERDPHVHRRKRRRTQQHLPTTFFTPEAYRRARRHQSPARWKRPCSATLRCIPRTALERGYKYLGDMGVKEVPWGASTYLERVVLTKPGTESLVEEVDGTEVPVSVTNTEEELAAARGAAELAGSYDKDAWHSTSDNGSRVFFTTPFKQASEIGQLYVRVNIGEPQSKLGSHGECLEPTMACTIEVSASTRSPEDTHGPRSRATGAQALKGKRCSSQATPSSRTTRTPVLKTTRRTSTSTNS